MTSLRILSQILICVSLSANGLSAEWVDISEAKEPREPTYRLVPNQETTLLFVKVDLSVDGSLKQSRRVVVLSEAVDELDLEIGELRTLMPSGDYLENFCLVTFRQIHRWDEEHFSFEISNLGTRGLLVSVNGRKHGDQASRLYEFKYTASELSGSEAAALIIETGMKQEEVHGFFERLQSYKLQDLYN